MTNIFETKLSTEDRNGLEDDIFGLPKERKYPLNDETRIRKAIQFFKYCPHKDRNELATNINKRLRETGLKIQVSEDNPFYKYANKELIETIVVEGYTSKLMSPRPIVDRSSIQEIEDNTCHIFDKRMCETRDHELAKDMVRINNELYSMYIDYIKYVNYNDGQITEVPYRIIHDMGTFAVLSLQRGDVELAEKACIVLNRLAGLGRTNKHHIFRESICIKYYIKFLYGTDCPDTRPLYKFIQDISNIDITRNKVNVWYGIGYEDEVLNILYNSGLEKYCTCLQEYFEECRKNKESELYIIEMDKNDNFKSIIFSPIEAFPFEAQVKLHEITNLFDSEKLRCLNYKNLSIKLTNTHLVRLNKLSRIANITVIHDKYGDELYCGNIENSIYLILSDTTENDQIVLIELTDNAISFFISDYYDKDNRIKLYRYKFIEKELNKNKSLTEGFTMDDDGNMKITISSKKSYMDEYSQNHKLLVENWKNKNYEGVKKNLAFVFALVNIIERDKKYKNRDPEVVKARAFAINDFKTYLKKLMEVEEDFDFVDYYKNSDYDKLIVNLPKQTIAGIKMLFKMLIK